MVIFRGIVVQINTILFLHQKKELNLYRYESFIYWQYDRRNRLERLRWALYKNRRLHILPMHRRYGGCIREYAKSHCAAMTFLLSPQICLFLSRVCQPLLK